MKRCGKMGFDFTVAISPSVKNIDRELQYVKSALLYADQITLISPVAYLYSQLQAETAHIDERRVIKLLRLILPLCEKEEPELYYEVNGLLNQLEPIVYSKRYKAVPLVQKLQFRRQLGLVSKGIDDAILNAIGKNASDEVNLLVKADKLKLYPFEHSLADTEGCVSEYFRQLTRAVKTSHPLFDEQSCHLMASAVKDKVIQLTPGETRKITHAGVSDNILQRLPSFEFASVDEILDIRSDLDPALTRYRKKMLEYSDQIQSVPWDADFENECSELYYKEIAPAVAEIDELTKENGFIKNLGYRFAEDENFLKSAGGLVVGVIAGGALASFTQCCSENTGMLVAGGAAVAAKIAKAYLEYDEKQKNIQKKDLYFYYQAGKRLKK